MKTLAIVAGSFFAASAILVAYFATSGAGHEYDLNYVVRIDPKDIPKSILPSPVMPAIQGEILPLDVAAGPDAGRAETSEAARQATSTIAPPVHAEDRGGTSPLDPRAQQ